MCVLCMCEVILTCGIEYDDVPLTQQFMIGCKLSREGDYCYLTPINAITIAQSVNYLLTRHHDRHHVLGYVI